MTTSEKINIAFAIDAKYTPHLEALLKSICYYNKNVNFYVLHNDIPQEWFEGIQCKLEKMGYNLFSIHISDDIFKDYKTLEHISSSSSYYRLMIPKLINHLDASVSKKYFNSGVLLIDCVKWRNEGLVDTLLQTVEEYGNQVLYGDQCILNIVLREKAKYYSFTENAQVQYIEAIKNRHNIKSISLDATPTIIHYAAKHKPWDNHNPTLFEREKYWFFRHLDWSYLIMQPNKIL